MRLPPTKYAPPSKCGPACGLAAILAAIRRRELAAEIDDTVLHRLDLPGTASTKNSPTWATRSVPTSPPPQR